LLIAAKTWMPTSVGMTVDGGIHVFATRYRAQTWMPTFVSTTGGLFDRSAPPL
jgi:hypothetical protein